MPNDLMQPDLRSLLRRHQLISLLEYICQALELPSSEYAAAEEKYTAVGKWLSTGDQTLFKDAHVYPQGSVALGTTVRPLAGGEFDIDLVMLLARLDPRVPPALVKAAMGARLREHAVYAAMLEEKPRCWRLHYAGRFHMDLTPSILNPTCGNGGELVPDKHLGCWKASNPQGYRRWFEEQAALSPHILTLKEFNERVRAQIDALPAQTPLKGILRRIVQLLKRHRDQYFAGAEADCAPISIVVTTLAAYSYAMSVLNGAFETELDVVEAVVAGLPAGLQMRQAGGQTVYTLANPTTEGENFCEKWNGKPALAEAFFRWHRAASGDLTRLLASSGLDQTRKELASSFGDKPVAAAFNEMGVAVNDSRRAGSLLVGTVGGLIVAPTPGAVRPLQNTNFGR